MSSVSGHSGTFQVFNKRQSTSPGKIRGTPKLETYVDRNLPYDWYSASISRKVIGREISHLSSADLYLCCRIYFASNVVQTEASQFVDLGIPAVNTSDEFGIQCTPATRIRGPTFGSHWCAPDHVFGKSTAVGMSVTSSE